MATSRDKRAHRAASRHERYEARVAASLNVARRFGWARGKISADLVDPEVRDLLVDLFAEGEASSRRKWSGEEALEWLSQRKDDDGNHRFSYARLPSLLGIKSVFARGKAMIAARRRAAEPGGRRSTRRRWTAAEDEAIREQLARGVRVAALDIPDRSKASIGASQQTVRGGQDRSGPARQRPWPRQLATWRTMADG